MQICVSGALRDLKNAEAWLLNPSLAHALRDLEADLRGYEQAWGHCIVFIECTFPSIGRRESKQVDLLIAFHDRAAVCEIKQGKRNDLASVQDWVDQTSEQKNLIGSHLSRLGHNELCLYAFLWTPDFSIDQLEATIKQIRVYDTMRNITPTGGNPRFRGTMLSEDIAAYLPDAIFKRLNSCRHLGEGVAQSLFTLLDRNQEKTGKRLLVQKSFQLAREYLQIPRPRFNIQLVHDATHVVGLRNKELSRGREAIVATRFLEVSGPAEVGKSTFVKEMLIQLLNDEHANSGARYEIVNCVLRKKGSIGDILKTLATEGGLLDSERGDRMDDNGFISLLGRSLFVFWISDFDDFSRPAVRMLAEKLKRTAGTHRCYWIIESMIESRSGASLEAGSSQRIELQPLDNKAIAAILRNHQPAAPDRNIVATLPFAAGIPGFAIKRWTLDDPDTWPKTPRLDQYQLFAHYLLPDERLLLPPISFLLFQSPFAVTTRLLEEWCRVTIPALGDIRRITRGFITKARMWRLISVETFGSSLLGLDRTAEALTEQSEDETSAEALSRIAMPTDADDALIGWLKILDPHFIDHFQQKIGAGDREAWREHLEEILIGGLDRNLNLLSLTGTTLSMLIGDLEPFVRSSFRSSSAVLPPLATWLASASDGPRNVLPEPNFAYFRRWLSWLIDYYWDTTGEVGNVGRPAWSINPPDQREKLQVLLFNTIRARGLSHWNGKEYDWNQWNKAIADFWEMGEFDLWAEAVMRQAQVRLRSPYNDPEAAWTLMQKVLGEEGKLTPDAGQPLVYFHVLSFLNKRKLWTGRIPSVEAQEATLTRDLSRKMIRSGLETENLNSIANALFFYIRWLEQQNRPTSSSEVDAYIAFMRLVQRISPARTIQALLTEGSIHRHYCSQESIAWEAFREHTDDALENYDRVIQSSVPARMMTMTANALSYSGLLLVKSLRFSKNDNFETWLFDHVTAKLETTRAFLTSVVGDSSMGQLGSLDRQLLCSLRRYKAMYLWIMAAGIEPALIHELGQAFAEAVRDIEMLGERLAHSARMKLVQSNLVEINRVILFTNDLLRHQQAIAICSDTLILFLKRIATILPKAPGNRNKSDLRKHGRRTVEALLRAAVNVSPELQLEFGATSP